MNGWTAAERTSAPALPLAAATEVLESAGFHLHARNTAHAVLKRRGTVWTLRARRFPLDLDLAETPDGGLHLRLRYDAFVLADDGELEAFADELVDALAP